MGHGPPGTSFAGLASGPPAYRPLLMPLRLSPRALRKHLLPGSSESPWRAQTDQPIYPLMPSTAPERKQNSRMPGASPAPSKTC